MERLPLTSPDFYHPYSLENPQFLWTVNSEPSIRHVVSQTMDIPPPTSIYKYSWIEATFRAKRAVREMENHTELSFLGTAGSFYIDARERTEPPLEKERHFELTVSKGIGIAKELRKLLAAVELYIWRDGKGNIHLCNNGKGKVFVQCRDHAFWAGHELDTVYKLVPRETAQHESECQLMILNSERLLKRIAEARGASDLDRLTANCFAHISLFYAFGKEAKRKTIEECPLQLTLRFTIPQQKLDQKLWAFITYEGRVIDQINYPNYY